MPPRGSSTGLGREGRSRGNPGESGRAGQGAGFGGVGLTLTHMLLTKYTWGLAGFQGGAAEGRSWGGRVKRP